MPKMRGYIHRICSGIIYEPTWSRPYWHPRTVIAGRWLLRRLERCESQGGNEIHIKLLKTIAIIDLFKERSGVIANFNILKTCFHEISDHELRDALSKLNNWSFTIFKKYLDAHAIFAGSDFDIDQATRSALEHINEIDFKELKSLAGIQPILAKRHYHETGVMRWFEVNIIPVSTLIDAVKHYQPEKGAIGQFVLAVPTEGENEEEAKKLCFDAVDDDIPWDSMVGMSMASWAIVPLARELLALEWVSDEHPELAGDSVARREVSARLAALQSLIETELHKSFDNAVWFGKTHPAKRLRQAELNNLASELADSRFNQCPRLHNELLNRQKPSGSAVAAQNILLRRMVLNKGEDRLGIQKFPAEAGLFVSILDASGLYRRDNDQWQFLPPDENSDPCHLIPMWEAATALVQENTIAVSDLYDLWRAPPYGVKDGLLPVLSVAFIVSQQEKLAVYREGLFKARFDDVDVDYLAKDPSTIQIRWMDLSDIARRLLSENGSNRPGPGRNQPAHSA